MLAKLAVVDLARLAHPVEHRDRRRQRIGKLLHRRRARLLQMVGADVHRVPLRRLAGAEKDHVLGQPERRVGREDVGAARQIFLDDVVLGGALKLGAGRALFVGDRHVERQQPGRGRVDGHRRVHRGDRDVRQTAPACRRYGRSRRRPCRLRPAPADGRCRSRSGSADRRRSRGRSGPWRGSDGRADLTLGGRMPGVGPEDPGFVASRRLRPPVRLRHRRTLLKAQRPCRQGPCRIARASIASSRNVAFRRKTPPAPDVAAPKKAHAGSSNGRRRLPWPARNRQHLQGGGATCGK